MRVLFAGSPSFVIPCLEAVAREQEICGILTNPDRPAGRKKRLVPSPVKAKAPQLDLPVYTPEKLDENFRQKVRALSPDILVVAAYGKIFKKEFLDLFPKGGINVHPSLLPKYRGSSPIPAAILAGDHETGVTIQRLALKMDAGDILAVEKIPLNGRESASELYGELFRRGARLLVSTLEAIEQGSERIFPQQEEEATYCPILRKEDGRVDWSAQAQKIERMIRAYDPWPGVFTSYKDRKLDLLSGGVYPEPMDTVGKEEGLVLEADNRYGILVNTGEGVLYIDRLQPAGKKPMSWKDFLNGYRDFIGYMLGGR